jgi:hypothetical protein
MLFLVLENRISVLSEAEGLWHGFVIPEALSSSLSDRTFSFCDHSRASDGRLVTKDR